MGTTQTELSELRKKYHGCSIKEFKEKLNLTDEQKALIKSQLLSIKWNFCIGEYENCFERQTIIDEMFLQFGVPLDAFNREGF